MGNSAKKAKRRIPKIAEPFDEEGALMCKKECLFIGSYGDEYPKGVRIERKRATEKMGDFLYCVKDDLIRVTRYCSQDSLLDLQDHNVYEDVPNNQYSKEYYLQEIASFLENCVQPGAMILYSGHGETGSGDWCFRTGTVSFHEIYELYVKHFYGKLLEIVVDSCNSGQWVLRLAEYLTSQQIGACGHCARDRGVFIKVFASCLPHESAYDGLFSDKGVLIDPNSYHLYFLQTKIKFEDKPEQQTPCSLDATKVCCFNSPEEECNWLKIPEDTGWNWNQLAVLDQRRSIGNRCYLLRNKDSTYWDYVLVKSHLVKNFLDNAKFGSIDGRDYGHILCSGWEDPPQDIINTFSPST